MENQSENKYAPGNVPVLCVEGRTLPETWEKSVLLTWERGVGVPTEYDKPGDPPSRDATMMMTTLEPMAEPRIHRAFPAGLEELEVYRQEVVLGVHDHWIDPAAGKWTYTYHKRLFDYEIGGKAFDQIAYMVDRLAGSGHTRRAQAITWHVALDTPTDDPPCLQRLWGRLLKDPDSGDIVFNFNSHWRSRDAYKAAFMNMFALTDLQRHIAQSISKKTGQEILLGRYTDISDSYHVYGSYFDEFKGFLNLVEKRAWEDRVWNTEFAESFFQEARKKLQDEQNS